MEDDTPTQALVEQLAALFAQQAQVQSVALGGSRAMQTGDSGSDIDLYVFTSAELPLEIRRQIVEQMGGAAVANLGLEYWGPGDEWIHAPTGIEVDIVYFDARWMEEQLRRVIDACQPSQGYSTCFWYTVYHARALRDTNGWFARLQTYSRQPYPESLRQNIIALNYPLLRGIIPAYAHQIEKAVKRADLVSINHRLAALLASYFDIVFAANRTLHPGEKRLLAQAAALCRRLPESMAEDVRAVIQAAGQDGADVRIHLQRLLDRLDVFLTQEGWDHAAKDFTPL